MASALELQQYIDGLRLNPMGENEGKWFTKRQIVHGVRGTKTAPVKYPAGAALPTLHNVDVADLLEQNAITTVDPNKGANSGDKEIESGSEDLQNKQNQAGQPQGGTDRTGVDENGNPIDPNTGQPVQQ